MDDERIAEVDTSSKPCRDSAESSALAVRLASATGPKIVHINTAEYVAHSNDIIAEPWISPKVVNYLYRLITHNNLDGAHFPVHYVPTTGLQWDVVDENPRIMHRTYRGRPLLVWVIGTLVTVTHASTIANPVPRLRVILDFLRTRDREESVRLYNTASSANIKKLDYFTAESPSSEDQGPATYDQVYDARDKFQGRTRTSNMPLSWIEGGDIVLAEFTVVRTEPGNGTNTASFALHALYWLAEKPRVPRAKAVIGSNEFPHAICA